MPMMVTKSMLVLVGDNGELWSWKRELLPGCGEWFRARY